MSETSIDAPADAPPVDSSTRDAARTDPTFTPEPVATPPCQSPPPAPRAVETTDDPRVQLLSMAEKLTTSRSHRLLMDYLRLRRAIA